MSESGETSYEYNEQLNLLLMQSAFRPLTIGHLLIKQLKNYQTKGHEINQLYFKF